MSVIELPYLITPGREIKGNQLGDGVIVINHIY
jgi:hypothetical protein